MFCDLVGSTARSTVLDPEDLTQVISAYHSMVAAIVARHRGIVAQYLGDGALVYFGYPEAHEDDTERALDAALSIIADCGGVEVRGGALQVRIGIATGSVVVGEIVGPGAAPGRGAIGETPNLAARLQALAQPDTIVIDEATRRLTGRLYDCADLGPQELKGFGKPVRAWRVIGPSAVVSRFEALHSPGLPLIGRQEEIEILMRRWAHARGGEGRVVILSGEAGIGKSRLAAAVQDRLAGEDHVSLHYACSPQHGDSALYPVISQLAHAAGLARGDSDAQRLDKLCALLGESARQPEDVKLIADLLSIPTGDRLPTLELSPPARNQRTLAALEAQMTGLAERQPLLIVFEDVHWADPTSLDLAAACVDAIERLKVLMILTSRPGFAPPWADRAHVTHLHLNRLSRAQALAMIDGIAGRDALTADVVEQILDRTDGVPLFVEELTKTVVETDALRGDGRGLSDASAVQTIPSTLQASLLARLDRLSPVREVAQVGAAIGREFPIELLGAVSRFSADGLRDALRQLMAADLVHRRADPGAETYKFKHALVQDAAYATLLRDQRRELHARIARAMVDAFPDRAGNEPEVVAYHFAQAGMAPQAIKYWHAAGARSVLRANSVEAVAYFGKALGLLDTLPEAPERDQQELGLRIALGVPLTTVGSYAAPAVGDNYRRAHELCKRMGNAPQVFPVLMGLYRFYLVSAELRTALETTTHLLEVAAKAQHQDLLTEAHQAHSFSLGFRGELAEAWEHCEKCLALFNPEYKRTRLHGYTTDTATTTLCLEGLIAWLRGQPDFSATLADRALERARSLDHPYSLAWALSFVAVLFQIRGDLATTRALAEECIEHCRKREFPFWLACGRIMRGRTLTSEPGRIEEGLAEMHEGLAAWHKTGARVYVPYFTCCLAEGYLASSHPADGIAPLQDMIGKVEHSGEKWWEPELYRLTGELMLRSGTATVAGAGAEQWLRKARDLAVGRGARSLELRAVMSLCRLSIGQRRDARSTERLAATLAHFKEGFGTADLVAARALRRQLRGDGV